MITADAVIQCQYAKQFLGYFLMTKLSLKKKYNSSRLWHQHQLIIAWKQIKWHFLCLQIRSHRVTVIYILRVCMKTDQYCMNPMCIYMIKHLMFPKVTLTCLILNIPLWKYSMSPSSIDSFKIKRTRTVKHQGLVVDDALAWSHYID